MSDISLVEIFRYPVKSMMGESLTEATFSKEGLAGDRVWAVRDERRGGIRGGKKIPQLMKLSAQTGLSAPLITAPDGDSANANAEGINDWLSEKLDHPVTLWPVLPADQLNHYRRGPPDTEDLDLELRTIFGRLPDEPLPDLTGFEELMEFESPPGTYFDAFPISILSRQSLESMSHVFPKSSFDLRRFRPNLLVDIPENKHPFPEQQWIGSTLSFGSVELKVESTCPRCSMTTHGFSDLPTDTNIMRHLVKHSGGNLGVYAVVRRAGSAVKGDLIKIQ